MPPLVYLLHKLIRATTETHRSATVNTNPSSINGGPNTDCDGSKHQCVGGSQVVPSLPMVEFGTVLVYSCSQSCWEDDLEGDAVFREECVVVQPDPDERICAAVRVPV